MVKSEFHLDNLHYDYGRRLNLEVNMLGQFVTHVSPLIVAGTNEPGETPSPDHRIHGRCLVYGASCFRTIGNRHKFNYNTVAVAF